MKTVNGPAEVVSQHAADELATARLPNGCAHQRVDDFYCSRGVPFFAAVVSTCGGRPPAIAACAQHNSRPRPRWSRSSETLTARTISAAADMHHSDRWKRRGRLLRPRLRRCARRASPDGGACPMRALGCDVRAPGSDAHAAAPRPHRRRRSIVNCSTCATFGLPSCLPAWSSQRGRRSSRASPDNQLVAIETCARRASRCVVSIRRCGTRTRRIERGAAWLMDKNLLLPTESTTSLGEYVATGGGRALPATRERGAQWVLDQLERSGLRGAEARDFQR